MSTSTGAAGLPDETEVVATYDPFRRFKKVGRGMLWILDKTLASAVIILIVAVVLTAGIAVISIPIAVGFGLGMLLQPWLAILVSLILIIVILAEVILELFEFEDNLIVRCVMPALLMVGSVMFLTAIGNSPTLFNLAAKVLSFFVR